MDPRADVFFDWRKYYEPGVEDLLDIGQGSLTMVEIYHLRTSQRDTDIEMFKLLREHVPVDVAKDIITFYRSRV